MKDVMPLARRIDYLAPGPDMGLVPWLMRVMPPIDIDTILRGIFRVETR